MPRAFSFQALEARYPTAPSLRLLHEVSKRNSCWCAAGNEEKLLCSIPGTSPRQPSRLGAAARCPQPVSFPKHILVKGCQKFGLGVRGCAGLWEAWESFPLQRGLGFGAVPLLTRALSIPLSGSRFEFGSKGRNMFAFERDDSHHSCFRAAEPGAAGATRITRSDPNAGGAIGGMGRERSERWGWERSERWGRERSEGWDGSDPSDGNYRNDGHREGSEGAVPSCGTLGLDSLAYSRASAFRGCLAAPFQALAESRS